MNMIRRKNAGFFVLFFAAVPFFPLSGVEITIPRMEIATRGKVNDDGEFALATNALVDLALDGGYKYGVRLGLSFASADLGKALAYRNFRFQPLSAGTTVTDVEYNSLAGQMNEAMDNSAVLAFRIAEATARDLFDLPLELSYFIGHGDVFGSGEEFAHRYGLFHIPTDYTGFYYFPDGIGGDINRRYDGIYQVRGAGFSFTLTPRDKFVSMFYVYQNIPVFEKGNLSYTGGRFSGDLRLLFNLENMAVESFGGLTGGRDGTMQFRGGALAWFDSGKGAEFLVQAGIPGWERGTDFGVDNLYFLMEPRLRSGLFAVHITFFYHPLVYDGIKTAAERGTADVNLKLMAGDIITKGILGGIETTLRIRSDQNEDLKTWLSPFVSFVSNGLQWNLKLRVSMMDYRTPYKMFEMFTGIKAAY
ncbi:MAG: hypothetical protein LBD71_04495 [Treponema sp.]|jgi:hypothetical protein|nr:hypothetical protein [Treponema sp.]